MFRTGLPVASLTTTTNGAANAWVTGVVWPLPDEISMVAPAPSTLLNANVATGRPAAVADTAKDPAMPFAVAVTLL